MQLPRFLSFLWLSLLLICTGASHALAGNWAYGEHSQARIISAQNATGNASELNYGIEIKLDKGWKTYWLYPGQAGLPPEMSWEGSENLGQVRNLYPAPKRFTLFDIDNFGYEDTVIFPFTATVDNVDQPQNLHLKLNILVCEEICVPEEMILTHHLPSGIASPSDQANLLAKWIKKAPIPHPFAESNIRINAPDVKSGLTLSFPTGKMPPFEDIFITSNDGASFGKPEKISETALSLPYRGSLYGEDTILDYLQNQAKITLIYRNAPAVEIAFEAADIGATNARDTEEASSPILYYFLIAILGGLILNLMPCVLPVLSLKILSLIGHSSSEQKHIRLGFLASSAGIFTAFMILAAVLSGLKQAGLAIGWGIQFQNPAFLIFMISIVMLFAVNLWGAFEIPLPRFIAKTAEKTHDHEPTLFGHFLTGILAMLLATPCSAPFLGTAVGFALSQGGGIIFIIFAGLALGLAAPYLLIALCPALAQFLPKPGAWMIKLRKALAIALLATAFWLGSVLYHVYSPDNRAIIQSDQKIAWQKFSPEAVKTAVSQGKIVFVDITADWCITCQANKRLTLHQETIIQQFKAKNIIALQGDWTRADQEITVYLQSYQKYGIPFNIVYGPNAPEGIILPELLTNENVTNALAQATK